MPYRCAVRGCSNTSDASKNIALHKIPFEADQRPEAKKRRRQWIRFVSTKRARWTPTTYSRVCSVHFTPEDFTRRFNLTSISLSGETVSFLPRLVSDEVGILPIPTIHSQETSSNDERPLSRRTRRMIIKNIIRERNEEATKKDEEVKEELRVEENMDDKRTGHSIIHDENKEEIVEKKEEKKEDIIVCSIDHEVDNEEDHEEDNKNDNEEGHIKEDQMRDTTTQTPDCYGCTKLASLNRQLTNKIVDLQQKISEKKAAIRSLEREKCSRK